LRKIYYKQKPDVPPGQVLRTLPSPYAFATSADEVDILLSNGQDVTTAPFDMIRSFETEYNFSQTAKNALSYKLLTYRRNLSSPGVITEKESKVPQHVVQETQPPPTEPVKPKTERDKSKEKDPASASRILKSNDPSKPTPGKPEKPPREGVKPPVSVPEPVVDPDATTDPDDEPDEDDADDGPVSPALSPDTPAAGQEKPGKKASAPLPGKFFPVQYLVPDGLLPRYEVRMVLKDQKGAKAVYKGLHPPNSSVDLKVEASGEASLEIWLNDSLMEIKPLK
jgi:hypothetical protein